MERVINATTVEFVPMITNRISYPLGWGKPSKHRKQASPKRYVFEDDETRQQRRARQRAEIKAFNRKDSLGNYVVKREA